MIGETLLKQCVLKMVVLVCGLEQKKTPKSLLIDDIHSRIVDMSFNILNQVMEELVAFNMELEKTTDVSQNSQLLVFVRHVHANTIKEFSLFYEPFLGTTNAIEIFKIVDKFFDNPNFNWNKTLGSLCIDGIHVMFGNTSGLATLGKKEVPQVIVAHCFLDTLASKTLKKVLSTSVKIVNFIRTRALSHCTFKWFCQKIRAVYEVFLYHIGVRWQILK